MDKQRVSYLFWRYWWLVVLIAVLSMAGTAAWLQQQAAVYSATAVIEVAQSVQPILDIKSAQSDNPQGTDYISTVTESLTGSEVLLQAADAIGLKAELEAQGMTDAAIVDLVRKKVTARNRPRTRLIDVSSTDLSPKRAQELANAVVKNYLEVSNERKNSASGSDGKVLEKRMIVLKKDLDDARAEMDKYQKEHPDLRLDNQTSALAEQAKQITEKRMELQAAKLSKQEDLNKISKSQDVEVWLQVDSLASRPAVMAARAHLQTQQDEMARVRKRYGERHPKFEVADRELLSANTSLRKALLQSAAMLKADLDTVIKMDGQLAADLAKQSGESKKMAEVLNPWLDLKSKADAIEKTYLKALDYQSQLTIQNTKDVTGGEDDPTASKSPGDGKVKPKDPSADKSPVRLTEPAMTPDSPIWPDKRALMLRAGILGLLGGLALLFLIDRLDNSFQSVDQVESELETTVLAAIPDDKVEKKQMGDLPMDTQPDSIQAEAYRTLRASIALLGEESQRRAILVTSAVPGEGKSRTSANLAIAFAQQGYRTLLIDADLRRPQQQRHFFPEEKARKARGLTECLSGLADTASVLRPTGVENLYVVLSGGRSPQPAELLGQKSSGQFIAHALNDFDRVVIDTPPVNSVADTLALIPHVHYVCLVVRACQTPRKEVNRALELLERASARVAGVVFNRLPSRVYGYYYDYKSDPYLSERDA